MKVIYKSALCTIFNILALASAPVAVANPGYIQALLSKIVSKNTIAGEISLHEKHFKNGSLTSNLIKPVKFHNDFSDFLNLSDNLDPELIQKIMDCVVITVNGYALPSNRDINIPLRTDHPVKISIIVKRGQIASLLALAKTKAPVPDWLNSSWVTTLLNILMFQITFECKIDQSDLSEVHYIAELICQQDALVPVINNPTSETISNLVKSNLAWPEWLNVSIDLPQVKKSS